MLVVLGYGIVRTFLQVLPKGLSMLKLSSSVNVEIGSFPYYPLVVLHIRK